MSESTGKQEVLEKIQKWLNAESIEFTMKENLYLDFQLDIKEPNQSIYSYNDKPDSIEFATYSSLTEEYKKAFIALKNNDEKLILWDLERSLLEINVGHNLVPNDKNLERVDIYKKIYFDGLTKDRLMDTIFALQRNTKLVELMFRQLTGKHSSYSTTTFIL